ncbi:hypothetical protein ILYODFUR_003111 [Ilyodon furcidens]|uniref:Uncharacterized protein n=1 Tax=Ilyodon furcidens TaxID=33524 RepID=A0ABV0TFL1_9TELE
MHQRKKMTSAKENWLESETLQLKENSSLSPPSNFFDFEGPHYDVVCLSSPSTFRSDSFPKNVPVVTIRAIKESSNPHIQATCLVLPSKDKSLPFFCRRNAVAQVKGHHI